MSYLSNHILQQFTNSDPRLTRKIGYQTTHQFNIARHQGLLPIELIKGKKILDIGSCTGTAGAWALVNGSAHYTAIEIQEELHDIAVSNFLKHFDKSSWECVNLNAATFFSTNHNHYDIILMSGVLHTVSQLTSILDECAKRAQYIIIDSSHPHLYSEMLTGQFDVSTYSESDIDFLHTLLESKIFKKFFRELLEKKLPILHFRESSGVFISSNQESSTVNVTCNYPSLGMLKEYFNTRGWDYCDEHYSILQKVLPDLYGFPHRFAAGFKKSKAANDAKLFSDYM